MLYIAVFAFLVYASYAIINQSVELNSKREQLADINHQIEIKEIEIEYQNEVENYSDDDLSDYIENIAREKLDYVKNGERVFINISGD
ncbi:MAG: septum formation initiator family protein [Ruminococcus sp.]|nr:septum formation initiator family protein [Ruminococcus sp.]